MRIASIVSVDDHLIFQSRNKIVFMKGTSVQEIQLSTTKGRHGRAMPIERISESGSLLFPSRRQTKFFTISANDNKHTHKLSLL